MKISSGGRKLIILFAVVALSAGVYMNTLDNGFVYDDENELLKNPWITDAGSIPKIFLSHSWAFESAGTSSHYHPMKFVVNMAQYSIFGTGSWGYHLTNMILHAMVGAMVFLTGISIFEKVSGRGSLLFAAAGAILFAVHPVHTEAVAWISAMPELAMSFLFMLSFFIYINTRDGNYGGVIASAVFFLIAAFFKETAMTLPLLIVAYDYSFKKGFFARVKGSLFRRYIPFAGAIALYLVMRFYAIKGFIPEEGIHKLNSYQTIINVFPLFSDYLIKLFLPLKLNLLHVFRPVLSITDARMPLALSVTLVFAVSVLIARNRNRGLFLGLLWIIIPLLPVFYARAFTGETVFAERYLYLPSAGLSIGLAFLPRGIYEPGPAGNKMTGMIMIMVFAAVTFLFAFATVKRNNVWSDNYTLWSDTVRKSPDSITARINMGIAHLKKNEVDAAIRELQTAVVLGPHRHEAHNNLGNAYYMKGRLDEAVDEYQEALRLKPDYADARYNLSVVLGIRQAIGSGKNKIKGD